jgi:hypothetical protein
MTILIVISTGLFSPKLRNLDLASDNDENSKK